MAAKGQDDLTEALAWCLEAIQERGLSPEACLERFPQHREELEPLLWAALELRSAPAVKPSAEFASQARQRLLRRLAPRPAGLPGQPSEPWRARPSVWGWQRRSFRWLATAALLALFFLAGATGLAYAADGASPGDSLYGLDRALETLQMALTPDAEARAGLAMAHAEERLLEVQTLIARGALEAQVEVAIEGYGENIRQAARALAEVAATGETARAEALARKLEETLSLHEQVLTEVAAQAPEQAQPALRRALEEARWERSNLETFPPGSPPELEELPVPLESPPEPPSDRPGGPPGTIGPGAGTPGPPLEIPSITPDMLPWLPTEVPAGDDGWRP